MNLRCEIAVVGSGPGGAVAACMLAEAGRDVLLIEEGPRLELDCCPPFSMSEMTQKYRNGGVTAAMGPCPIAYVEGRVVGGGSEINSALYHRLPEDVRAGWRREYGVEGLGPGEWDAGFQALEAELPLAADTSRAHPAGLKLELGAQRVGWPCRQALRMAAPGEGAAPGRRLAMSRTYIPRALRAGCRLLDQTRIRRLVRGSGRWSLQTRDRDAAIEAENVFLACGAVHTPALLQRSGFAGLAGASLALHPMLKLVAEFDQEVNALGWDVAAQQVKPAGAPYAFGCSISSPSNLALILTDHPAAARGLAGSWRRMAAYYVVVPGSGRGAVRALPGWRDPLVRYRVSDADMSALGQGLRGLAELLFAAGARRIYPSAAGYGPWESAAAAARELTPSSAHLMTVHLMGSCPMGENRRLCPADSFGRWREAPGLYLADASLLCGPISVNPQGSIMALARRNILKFLGGL